MGAAKEGYMSFGGEVRFQYLWFKNDGWGDEPADKDDFVLIRYIDSSLNKC